MKDDNRTDIDIQEIIRIVKQTNALFHHEENRRCTVKKGDRDFVTKVDFSVQEFLWTELGSRFPDIQFLSEEKDNRDVDFSRPYWILDPVDGTTNLIYDFRFSAVSLALCAGGDELAAGVIYQPYSDELFHAVCGQGAWLNDQPIHVGTAATMEESLVILGTNPYDRSRAKQDFDVYEKIFEAACEIRILGSAALDLAYVACGRADAFLERHLKPHDFAAGVLLIREAGGKVTDFSGVDVAIAQSGDLLTANEAIWRKMFEAYAPLLRA
ncbi:inositol monophosphatase [Clostridia bacterium]|nr:inositol monophosphatase [Clostridia bacterium]